MVGIGLNMIKLNLGRRFPIINAIRTLGGSQPLILVRVQAPYGVSSARAYHLRDKIALAGDRDEHPSCTLEVGTRHRLKSVVQLGGAYTIWLVAPEK